MIALARQMRFRSSRNGPSRSTGMATGSPSGPVVKNSIVSSKATCRVSSNSKFCFSASNAASKVAKLGSCISDLPSSDFARRLHDDIGGNCTEWQPFSIVIHQATSFSHSPSIGCSSVTDEKSAGGSTDPLAARAFNSRSVFMATFIGPNTNTVTVQA